MKRHLRTFLLLLFLSRPRLSLLPPAARRSGPAPAQEAQQFTLANGLTLIVKPDRRAPTAVHMLCVRVGAMDEVDGTSGVAHVLEHMLFKGTPTSSRASSRAGSPRSAAARTPSPPATTPATSSRSPPASWRT